MTLEVTRVIASKYDSREAVASTIVDITGGSTATLTLTIPIGFVFYLFEYGGNSTTSDINIVIRNQQNQIIVEYTELPDFPHVLEYLPHLKEEFRGNISVLFTNNTGVTSTITYIIRGLLIPFVNKDNFIKEIRDYFSIPKMLKGEIGEGEL